MNTIKLNNNVFIPQLGLGVFQSKDGDEAKNAIKWALEAGYRHIDTAMFYGNETSVGEAIRECNIPREEIFVTTKLWNDDIRNGNCVEALEGSIRKLGFDYVDLYLIHWPADGYKEAWKDMEQLYKEGKIKSIGVSNFQKHHLEEIEKIAEIMPVVNQIESHPYFNNQELIEYCQNKDIAVEVWSPLGGGRNSVLNDEIIRNIGQKNNTSNAQVVLRWHIQRGVIVLPKSVHKERIQANYNVYDFELTDDDMKVIDGLNKDLRVGPNPDNFDF